MKKSEIKKFEKTMATFRTIKKENTVKDDFPKLNRSYKIRPTAQF